MIHQSSGYPMLPSTIPINEKERLKALYSYNILHTDAEIEYDQITELASSITGMPISLISFVDKDEVWYKSTKGVAICSNNRDVSFCSRVIESKHPTFIVNDAKNDDRFFDNPYVTENVIGFYAGVSLIDKEGYKLGTLCVVDNKPNIISKKQEDSLHILAKQVTKLIELHRVNNDLIETKKNLEQKNEELKSFAGVVSHDMKMPLANIILTTDILKFKYQDILDSEAKDYLTYLKQSSFTLSDYITGLLEHYESDKLDYTNLQTFDIHHLLEEIVDLLNINLDCEIHFPEKNIDLHCNRVALEQIFLNLIANSIKYNDKEKIVIDIECKEEKEYYLFKVTDNGRGIPEDKINDVFELFTTLGNDDRQGNRGNGIGLSTVKKIVTSLGGTIDISSVIGKNTSFIFSVKKT